MGKRKAKQKNRSKIIVHLQRFRAALAVAAVVLAALVAVSAVDIITCSQVHGEGITCRKIGFITKEERYRDEEGKFVYMHEFTDVQNGDILISMSTHTLGWRHGHAALVIDAERGITLEAALWGKPSAKMRMRHWSAYANAVHLRVSEEAAEKALADSGIRRNPGMTAAAQLGQLATEFAEKNEDGIMYGLLTGIPDKAPDADEIKKTQCAHLVWYAYSEFGVDLDSDGGWLVTPRDIAESEELTVIEEFGTFS